jgi:23S rRNA pseudouridine955/2504/2580 synthase
MSPIKDFSKAQIVEITDDRENQRLDNFLIQYYKQLPKARIYRLIRKGEVRINGGRVKPDARLMVGDKVRIPPVKDLIVSESKTIAVKDQRRLMDGILYEDNDLLILNKPPGMAVHAGSGVDYGAIDVIKSLSDSRDDWRLAHRLDQGTSGCLMIAKNMKVLRALQEALNQGQIEKTYVAILVGHWKYPKEKCVDLPLSRDAQGPSDRLVSVDEEEGKVAISHFTLLKQFKKHCLVEVRIETGRTHQIRVHAESLGLPVLGDRKYGLASANEFALEIGIKRLCLHATRLRLIHPTRGEPLEVSVPFDAALLECLSKL